MVLCTMWCRSSFGRGVWADGGVFVQLLVGWAWWSYFLPNVVFAGCVEHMSAATVKNHAVWSRCWCTLMHYWR